MENIYEVAETIQACELILEEHADDDRELWAVIAALRECRDYLDELRELDVAD